MVPNYFNNPDTQLTQVISSLLKTRAHKAYYKLVDFCHTQ